jgi:prophage antirepressor-like protein
MKDNELTPFEGKEIRKVWHDEQWYFSVIDVIEILTDSPKPKRYWTDLKRRTEKESGQTYSFCVPLKLLASDGRKRLTDCANAEGILRIVMSVPSPKAEPLRLWLAQVGAERIQETENPELIYDRMTEIYRAKGHTEKWIKERIQTIRTRNKLTDEWKARGVKEGQEYSILTATIAKGTFGMTPSEHAQFKGLEKQNLRDHMTDLELIFTALSEEVTRTITIKDNAQGFAQNHDAAAYGGDIARSARLRLENEKGIKVVSSDNFLGLTGGDKPDELPPEKTE